MLRVGRGECIYAHSRHQLQTKQLGGCGHRRISWCHTDLETCRLTIIEFGLLFALEPIKI